MDLTKHIWTLTKAIQNTLNPDSVNKTAHETGFSIRSSKLTPVTFLGLCTLSDKSIGNDTLPTLCGHISHSFQASISKQALHERFNAQAVAFLHKIYKQLAASQIGVPTHIDVSYQFSRIRIMDSTSFEVEGEHPDYPGFQNSGVSIQFDYDLISGSFLHQEVHPQKKSDKSAAREIMDSLLP